MSQQSIEVLALSLKAVGVIASRRFVGYDALQATVQGQAVMGVARSDGAIADQVPLDVIGTAVIESGGVIAVGDELISDAQGRAIKGAGALAVAAGATPVTSTAANGAAILTGGLMPEHVAARALESASAAGEFIEVLLIAN